MRTVAFGLMLISLMASTATARIWTSAQGGGKVDAEFLGMEECQVKLKFNRTGNVVLVSPGTLCEADQQYIQELVAKQQAAKDLAENGPPDRFDQAIMDDPTNPEKYIDRGMARTNRKQFEGAIKDFTKAIELNPEASHAFNGRGLAYHKKGDLVPAQTDFNQAIRLNPELASAYRNRGENLYKLALDKDQSVPELTRRSRSGNRTGIMPAKTT